MTTHHVGVIMNGVTGRMGTNQHLMRSMVEIIKQGGVWVGPAETIMPAPILVGRNEGKLEKLCQRAGIKSFTTNVDEALADESNQIYFDSQVTGRRHPAVKKAIDMGLHVYCEKPTAVSTEEALDLY
ncbi:MAG: Gfo/Idh/MocA family oxidoreductase, partial [Bacteroidetes bacterium]|nr:Gfo/Idh/MocA family oxidoreductase [Bacteroidota bacterium]